MKKSKLILIAAFMVAITALMPSCSVFKKRSSDLEKSSFSQKIESKSQKDSSSIVTDKTVTTEKTTEETTTESSGVKIKTEKEGVDLAALAKGVKSVDSGLYAVFITFDNTTGKLTTEIEKKPEKTTTKKTTEKATYNDINTNTNTSVKKENKEAVAADNKKKATKSEPKGLAWLWAIVASVAGIAVVGLLAYFGKLQNLFKKK